MIGRLLLFDALKMGFRELRLRKDPACVLCGKSADSIELIDYEEFCGIVPDESTDSGLGSKLPTISPEELKKRLAENEDIVLLNVREPVEWQIVRLSGATLLPTGHWRSPEVVPQELRRSPVSRIRSLGRPDSNQKRSSSRRASTPVSGSRSPQM